MRVIEFRDVWEKYRVKYVREGKIQWEEFWALQDVTFSVEKGEVLGIIGENGAGKTTILKLIAGMIVPDKGEVLVRGRVSALMELGAGFNPEFTGRENILLNAYIYGISKETMKEKISKIIEFADIGKFIDAPLKYYSQGMYARLAFSLAIHVDPEIFLVDDILAVGDEGFQDKCISKILEMKNEKKTIVIVSHNTNMLKKLCDRILFLEKGKIVKLDVPQKVIHTYLERIGDKKGIAIANNKLRVTFNNGKLFITYNENSLGEGSYFSFWDDKNKCWMSSANLEWIVKKNVENGCIVEGISKDKIISMRAKILLKDEEIEFDIFYEGEKIKDFHWDIMLAPCYDRYFTDSSYFTFPDFSSKEEWQKIRDVREKCFGVFSEKLSSYLVIEKEKCGLLTIINTGYTQESRVVSIYSLEGVLRCKFHFFNRREIFENFFFKKREKFEESDLSSCVRPKLLSIGERDLKVSFDLERKVVHLYYKEKRITVSQGMIFGIKLFSFKNYHLFNYGEWKIHRLNNNEAELLIEREDIVIRFLFKIDSDDNLFVKEKIEFSKYSYLEAHHFKLEIEDSYVRWRTPYEEGEIPEEYIDAFVPIRMKELKTSSITFYPKNSDYPILSITSNSHPSRKILTVFKIEECLCVQYQSIFFEEEKRIDIGDVDSVFEIIFKFREEKMMKPSLSLILLCKNKGKDVIFDQGRGKIFWKGKELTSNLGFFTSLRVDNIWYDSYQAIWKIEKKNDIWALYGKWFFLPLYQIWKLKIENTDIFWEVSTILTQDIFLEIEQVGIMLSNKYKKWKTSLGIQGEFDEFYSDSYDILPFRYCYLPVVEGDWMKVEAEDMPSVFFVSLQNSYLRMLVANTDVLYKSRLIQFQRVNVQKEKSLCSRYLFFKGKISLEEGKDG